MSERTPPYGAQGQPAAEPRERHDAEVILAAGRKLALTVHNSKDVLGPRGKPYFTAYEHAIGDVLTFVGGTPNDPWHQNRPPGPRNAVMHDLESFIAWWRQQSVPESRIYAEMHPSVRFTAVIDDETDGEIKAWRDNRCVYAPKYSPEWSTWTSRHGEKNKFPGNEEFAVWLEDNLPDIVEPRANDLFSIVKSFHVSEDRQWSKQIELADGAGHLSYKRIVDGTGTLAGGNTVTIPNAFKLRVAVFEGINAQAYEVDARFRYRVREGSLSIWYELVRPHKIVEQAFEDMLRTIGAECTNSPVFYGSPDR